MRTRMVRTPSGLFVPEHTDAPQRLCPVCDLIHGHETELVVQEGARPEVYCPCAACQENGLRWDTNEEYMQWLEANIGGLERLAEAKRLEAAQDEPDNEEDHEWESKVDDLVDRRIHKIEKKKSEGTYDAKKLDVWEGEPPPD